MENSTNRPRKNTRRFLQWLGIGTGSVCALVGVQQLLIPEIDQGLTAPVVIDNQPDSLLGHSRPNESGSASELPDSGTSVPETSITYGLTQAMIDQAEHPLDPVIEVAKKGLAEIDQTIQDYTSTMIGEVYADGKLHEEKYVFCKVRHRGKTADGDVPFSIYVKFLKPQEMVGKEVIWVEGRNQGKIIAHEVGLKNVMRFPLDPNGAIAMEGNRYPIDCFGFKNLFVKLIEFCEEDRKHDDCQVKITRNIKINGRTCTLLESLHEHQNDAFGFHIARMYIDDQWNIPIAYEGYRWPEKADEPPPVLEKYYYTDLKFNVGLDDEDFDPGNPDYGYPRW